MEPFSKRAARRQGSPLPAQKESVGPALSRSRKGGGNLSEMTQEELDFLGETEEERLACQVPDSAGDCEN